MKKIILLIILILITGCSIIPEKQFKEISDINHIKDNKDKIESVIVTRTTLGSHDCYKVDTDKAYASVNSLKILKESNMSVTDNYMSYFFYFGDGTKTTLSFEGPYLVENKKSYTIDFKAIDLLEEDLIECEN